MTNDADCLRKTYFDEVKLEDGRTLNVPKPASLKEFGEPPWTLEIADQWERLIPPEASDLVGTIVWRGSKYQLQASYRAHGHRWMPTSVSYTTDANTSILRDVYVNGIRFTRVREVNHDDVDSLD